MASEATLASDGGMRSAREDDFPHSWTVVMLISREIAMKAGTFAPGSFENPRYDRAGVPCVRIKNTMKRNGNDCIPRRNGFSMLVKGDSPAPPKWYRSPDDTHIKHSMASLTREGVGHLG
jgi:hypothetical protein